MIKKTRNRRWIVQGPADPTPRVGPPVKFQIDLGKIDPALWRVNLDGGNYAHPTGHCHDCGALVSGERRYCGPCPVRHTYS